MNNFHVQIKHKGKRKVVAKIYDNETHTEQLNENIKELLT